MGHSACVSFVVIAWGVKPSCQVRLRRHRLHTAQQFGHVAFFGQHDAETIELRLFGGELAAEFRELTCRRKTAIDFPFQGFSCMRRSARLSRGPAYPYPRTRRHLPPPRRRTRRSVHTMAVGQG